MSYKLQSEELFLLNTAVKAFNKQYGRSIDPQLCTIRSIPGAYGKTYGYEILTARTDDFLRLRMYFSIGGLDAFSPYRIELQGDTAVGSLADEVYVMNGVVNRYYVDSGTYRFRWIGPQPHELLRFDDMDGVPMNWMDGDKVEYVELVV